MRTLRSLASLFVALAVAASSAVAIAAPPKKKPVATRSKATKDDKASKGAKKDKKSPKDAKAAKIDKAIKSGKTLSIGAPNAGHLQGASRLKGSKYLKQREGAHSWGLPALVNLLGRASSAVGKKHKGSMMLVGDLSGKTGGPLEGHGSHQTGRDADVAFYAMNSKGKPLALSHFVPFNGDSGKGRIEPGVLFDDARNWMLVESLIKDDKTNVRYLFVSNPLKGRLLAYAMHKQVNKDLIVRAASVMMSPTDADVHDDHFHVRIACPETMRDVCLEEAMIRAGGAAGSGDGAGLGAGGAAGGLTGNVAAGDGAAGGGDAPKPAGDAAPPPAAPAAAP